jgi:hypothetical protein
MQFAGSNSGWIIPFLKSYDEEIRFRPDGHWWDVTARAIRAARKVCDGKVLICGTHLQANLDALAAIRGAQQLMEDLMLRPEAVKQALQQIDKAVVEVHAALSEELDVARFGSANRSGAWAPGITTVPQCDFSCMISDEMFREFALPHLEAEISMTVSCLYHLDGPGAIRHLEAVCELDKVMAIEWVPGAGTPSEQDWTGLYRRIEGLGKGYCRRGMTPEMVVESWCRHRSPYMHFRLRGVNTHDDFWRLVEDLSTGV